MKNAVLLGFLLGSAALFGQEVKTVPYLPLVYEVRFHPTPVKGEGRFHLIYELHLANFSRREITLRRIEVLGKAKDPIKAYEGDRLSESLTRPGKPLDVENKLVLEGGAQAVLFIMVSFKSRAEIPESLTHRVTAEYLRGKEEKVVVRGRALRSRSAKRTLRSSALRCGRESGWPGMAPATVRWAIDCPCSPGTESSWSMSDMPSIS